MQPAAAMGHDPLFPEMPPAHTRVLAVGGDATRLHNLATNLRRLGYQMASSTDPAAAMSALRQGGGLSFDVVMVDRSSPYPGGARAAALELFEFAICEPQLCAYGINENETYGPLVMEDLNQFRKPVYSVELNGLKSPEVTPNGLYNNPPSTTVSTIPNLPFLGRMVGEKSDTKVEQDGEHAKKEDQQPSQEPKKARVVWTDELHKKFVAAYNKLLPRDAMPKKILELMNDPTLTRENIASHLQKHKANLRREACSDPFRSRSHSRTKQDRSTPQASFPSHNMPRKQAPAAVMESRSTTLYANHVVIHVQTFNTVDKTKNSVLVGVPPKDMYPGDDDSMENSVSCVGNSGENSVQEDTISVILSKEPKPSWDTEFLHSSHD